MTGLWLSKLGNVGQIATYTEEMMRFKNVTGNNGSGTAYNVGPSTSRNNLIDFLEAEPAIDMSPKKTESEVVMKLANQLPNLPLTYLHANKGTNDSHNGFFISFKSNNMYNY